MHEQLTATPSTKARLEPLVWRAGVILFCCTAVYLVVERWPLLTVVRAGVIISLVVMAIVPAALLCRSPLVTSDEDVFRLNARLFIAAGVMSIVAGYFAGPLGRVSFDGGLFILSMMVGKASHTIWTGSGAPPLAYPRPPLAWGFRVSERSRRG